MSQKKRLFVANWKMSLGRAESLELAKSFRELAEVAHHTELWIAPSAALMGEVSSIVSPLVRVGSQNVHSLPSGAFTGEVSVPLLKELGVSFAITGHSERRNIFGESDEMVAARTIGALNQGIDVILCIGESLHARESSITESIIRRQLEGVVQRIESVDAKRRLLIAYEPIWAIGTGKVATVDQISDAHQLIVSILRSYGFLDTRVLYGGSVTEENAAAILSTQNVSGCLVGGASTKAISVKKIFEMSENLKT